ncbi:hypothetical protein HWV62_34059 [Athelia sp. TMB]|nr:hypothetical protein HWV62_34059 [Athelia sp. TMB]
MQSPYLTDMGPLRAQQVGPWRHDGCWLYTDRYNCSLVIPWEALFAYDVMVVTLTVLKTWRARHRFGFSPGYVSLFGLILRDGAMYFTVMAFGGLANVLTFYYSRPLLKGVLSSFSSCMSVVLISRLMLNLHTTATAGVFTSPNGSSQQLTSVEFNVQEMSVRDTSEDTCWDEDPPSHVDQIPGFCEADKAELLELVVRIYMTGDPEMLTPTVTRSDVWLEDGNIVLQAEGTQFKVYRGILALNSPIFDDMFSMPQPVAGPETQTVEGCPVVQLMDSAADVKIVLQALCQRRYVALKAPLPINVIAAFLRMGHKYDIDVIRDEALQRLYYESPTTLEDWVNLDAWSMIVRSPRVNAQIANLAREHNLLSVLAIALHSCTIEIMGASGSVKNFEQNNATHKELTPENERACFLAYPRLLRLQGGTTLQWCNFSQEYFPGCISPFTCPAARKNIIVGFLFPVPKEYGFDEWQEEWEEDMCVHCITAGKEYYKAGCHAFWNGLPTAFGLPTWHEIKKERTSFEGTLTAQLSSPCFY